jgi:hypothetical protein
VRAQPPTEPCTIGHTDPETHEEAEMTTVPATPSTIAPQSTQGPPLMRLLRRLITPTATNRDAALRERTIRI